MQGNARIRCSTNLTVQERGVQTQKVDSSKLDACTSPVESLDDQLASAKRTLEAASTWDPWLADAETEAMVANLLFASDTANAFEAGLGAGWRPSADAPSMKLKKTGSVADFPAAVQGIQGLSTQWKVRARITAFLLLIRYKTIQLRNGNKSGMAMGSSLCLHNCLKPLS
jgi:hypothetical protein